MPTAAVLDIFKAAPRYLNPAIALHLQLEAEHAYQPEDVMKYRGQIDDVIEQAQQEIRITNTAIAALKAAPPIAAQVVPEGF